MRWKRGRSIEKRGSRVRYFLTAAALALAFAPAASATTTQLTVPFSDVVPNPCNGDMVAVTGAYHAVEISGNNQLEIQTNWPDTSGVSLTAGTLYQANQTTHVYFFSTGPKAFTFTIADSYELVSQDGSSNFLVHESATFDLSGDVLFSRGGEECSGPTPAP
jgi:hypothetical protein